MPRRASITPWERVRDPAAAKLRLISEALNQTRGVYLFDEFDSIGSARGLSNDVGEIQRVSNSFLQMVEQDNSDSLSGPRKERD